MPAADLSTGAQRDIPAIAVRKYRPIGLYLDWGRTKVHVMWEVGYEDANGDFVRVGEVERDEIKDGLNLADEPDKTKNYYSQMVKSQAARDLVALAAQYERARGRM